MSIQPNYNYRAKILKWVDGDTVDLEIDLGFFAFTRTRCRLAGIDTPERGQVNWAEATAFAAAAAPAGSMVHIYSKLPADKYGRFLVTVYADDELPSVNLRLVGAGLARWYEGGAR